MNAKIDILLFIETYKMKLWKERIAAFRYEILPESLIANEKTLCGVCSSIDIINVFCNYADFGLFIRNIFIPFSQSFYFIKKKKGMK